MHAFAGRRILMLLENNPYPQDVRVRREASTLTDAGYQVTVIAPRRAGQPWHEQVNGTYAYRFPAPPEGNGLLGYLWEYGYSMAAMFLLSLLVLIRQGYDIVHVHNPPDTLVLLALFYKGLGKRFVFDHHDLSPELYYARFGGKGNPLVYRVLLLFETWACQLADQVIATNQSYKQMEVQRAAIPEEKIIVVRNGPDLNYLRPVAVDPTLRQEGKTMLCYVGHIGFHDGVDHLLHALRHLVYELGRTDICCLFVGDGDAGAGMRALAQQLHLMDYLLFAGWVDHSEVKRYLSAADICLAPEPSNPYNDRSTAIKLTEYMALGKPIVAFDLPEHRVTAQDAAVYAQPNEEADFARQITILMDNPEQRRKMSNVGRQRIETALAWSHQAQHLLTAYRRLSPAPIYSTSESK